MRRVCTVCARSGSKGFPSKNEVLIQGYPLYAISLLQAQKSKLFDEVVFSTDSEKWMAEAHKYGATQVVSRPAELASDTAGKVPVIRHAVESVQKKTGKAFQICVDLDVTSPLRFIEDIKGALKMLEATDATNIITGTSSHRSPYFNLVEINMDGYAVLSKPLGKIVRRQDAPKCFDMNASIYVWPVEILLKSETVFLERTRLYEMPEERSRDIDSKFDYEIVKFIAEKNQRFRDEW